MKKIISVLFVLVFSLALYAQQLSKVYVLSEGGFSVGSSKLSMLDVAANNFTSNIFTPGNIGLYPDGLIYYENYLYLLEQGNFGSSGKIYKIDTLGNVMNSVSVGTNPYSLAVANDKIYITNGPAGNISIINLSDLSFIKNLQVGVYPQEILSLDNKIFVANTSLFGGAADSTISVVDAESDTVIAVITVRKDPTALAVSSDDQLLIGCQGDESYGMIYKVNPNTFQKVDSTSISTYGFGKDISVDKNSDDVFFIAYTNDIVKYNLSSGTGSVILPSVFPNNNYYGYIFDYTMKRHCVLDAKSFIINGSLVILDSAGTVLNNFETGIAPRRVVLKYNQQATGVDDDNIANTFNLEQNYPNPFNPATTIQYSLSEKQFVTLKVFDILGNEIASLVNEEKPAGKYSIDFSSRDIASGVYIYTLITQSGYKSNTISKKMTVLK